MTGTPNAGQAASESPGAVLRAKLPADLSSARQARSAVRRALTAWGIDDPDGDAELLASELVANAAEHASGSIGLALRRHAQPDGQRGITCEVTDASPSLPPAQPGPGLRRTRPRAGDRHRTGHRQRRPRRTGWQDHLVHPRSPRPHRPRCPAGPDRSRSRSLNPCGRKQPND
jgi:anti-sigma regulatory factor (Ser/Thr protein kinase)